MNWISRWMERRRVNKLKSKLAKMKRAASAAAVEPLMPAVDTISGRIRLERIDVLEKAVEKIDARQSPRIHPPA
jgi:hypothetical protein